MSTSTNHPAGPAPWLWMILNLPFGATSGYVAVTLGFTASRAGLSDSVVAGLVASMLLPHTWKFLWAPISDMTLTRKRWYLLANLVTSLTLGVIGFIPLADNLALVTTLVFVNSVFVSFLGMAVEGLMAHTTPPEKLGRAAGWFQAGNLGGSGVGGGIALLIAEHVNDAAASAITGALLLACSLALRGVPDPIEERVHRVGIALKNLLKDVWGVIGSRNGIVAIGLCLLPLCAGAASGLFGAIASDWGADENVVAIVTGVLGGLVSAAGCLLGGGLSDRLARRNAYALSGIILAAVGLGMALAPKSAVTYAVFVLLYSLASGIAYGTFTGFVLEVIGKGAAATKYNALASLSNVPILYMTLVLGWVSDTHGPEAMLFADAGLGVVGVLALLGLAMAVGVGGRARPAVVGEVAPR